MPNLLGKVLELVTRGLQQGHSVEMGVNSLAWPREEMVCVIIPQQGLVSLPGHAVIRVVCIPVVVSPVGALDGVGDIEPSGTGNAGINGPISLRAQRAIITWNISTSRKTYSPFVIPSEWAASMNLRTRTPRTDRITTEQCGVIPRTGSDNKCH